MGGYAENQPTKSFFNEVCEFCLGRTVAILLPTNERGTFGVEHRGKIDLRVCDAYAMMPRFPNLALSKYLGHFVAIL